MARTATATLVISRGGMGEGSTDEDYLAFVSYVQDRIDARTGLDVTVETTRPRDVQETRVRASCDADRQTVREAHDALWEEFCADVSAWPSREVAS